MNRRPPIHGPPMGPASRKGGGLLHVTPAFYSSPPRPPSGLPSPLPNPSPLPPPCLTRRRAPGGGRKGGGGIQRPRRAAGGRPLGLTAARAPLLPTTKQEGF